MERRNTPQRKIVLDSIEKNGHISTENLINYVNQNYKNISLATIYRNINILLEENKIKRLQFLNDEVLETTKDKHYHLKCKCCGNIVDIDINSVDIKVNNSYDDAIVSDVLLLGVCQNCKGRYKK